MQETVRDVGSILGSGRPPGEGNGNPLQYSCLESFMDRGAWQATVHRVTESRTRLKVHAHIHRHTHTHTHIKYTLPTYNFLQCLFKSFSHFVKFMFYFILDLHESYKYNRYFLYTSLPSVPYN